ncbi:transposase [Caldisphaera sp.]|uniref:transposase n=1 Tax=Caldisphaera sp. TaxID=2060322 RepID=UPI003D09A78A
MIDEFKPYFKSYRGFKQFKNLASAMVISDSRSVAHLNGLNIDHTNQSNLNMFRSNYDKDGMFNKVCEIVNSVEEDTVLVIDDTIIERNGKNIEYTDIFFDHNKKKYVRGYQVATSLFVGKYCKYPIALSIYRKFNKENPEFKAKIEIQKENIEDAIKRGLNFSTVIGDSWYFTNDLVKFLNAKGKSWIFTSKGNRGVKIQGRWTFLDELILPYAESQLLTIDGEIYSAWEKEVYIRG